MDWFEVEIAFDLESDLGYQTHSEFILDFVEIVLIVDFSDFLFETCFWILFGIFSDLTDEDPGLELFLDLAWELPLTLATLSQSPFLFKAILLR